MIPLTRVGPPRKRCRLTIVDHEARRTASWRTKSSRSTKVPDAVCSRCRSETPAGARFCNHCGTPLAASCPACGQDNPRGSRFCNACGQALTTAPGAPGPAPDAYTPPHLAARILTSRTALEGERKHVTILLADLKGSMELLAGRDPEEARQLLDPVLERMMEAVHHYEGTVNQVLGDGIMALFGAPLAHEDHAVGPATPRSGCRSRSAATATRSSGHTACPCRFEWD
jgi:hypothetical protein